MRFIRINLKLMVLLILEIINIPISILDILSIYLLNKRELSLLVLTESDISVLADYDKIGELDDEGLELWLNKYLLVTIKLSSVFYIIIALLILLIVLIL